MPGMSKNFHWRPASLTENHSYMYYHNLAMSPQQRQPDTQQTESLGKGESEAGVGREGKKDSVINEQHKKIVFDSTLATLMPLSGSPNFPCA